MRVAVKLEFNTGVETINIPTKWSDVPFKDLVRFVNLEVLEPENILSILTGLQVESFDALPESVISFLYQKISFIADKEELTSQNYQPMAYESIGLEDWEKLETCKFYIRQIEGKHLWNAASDVVKVYTKIDISDLPSPKAVAMANFFLEKSQNFWNNSNNSMSIDQLKRKLWQELTTLQSSDISTHSIDLRTEIH